MNTVELDDITKTYNASTAKAVDTVSLKVKEAELFGLIGPDGAGKTTIFRILATLLLADSGQASVDGLDVVKNYRAIRDRIGYMPGKFSLYQDLTVYENLQFFATLFGTSIEKNYDLIKNIYEQIKPFRDRRAGKLSGGMKQKLALCCALIHKPRILLLDEPTTGVDVVSRREFWEMLHELKRQGITILVSTPYMDEAMLCERIALIQTGKIMTVDSPAAIIDSYPTSLFAARASNIYKLMKDLRQNDMVESCYPFGEFLHFTLKTVTNYEMQNLEKYAQKLGHSDFLAQPITPTIEDSFIRLMNNNWEHGN